MSEAARGPLAGVRIVDLTINLSGPFATMILAQQGADVIKVGRPPGGDIIRHLGSSRGGTAAFFVNTNWGKRSITLDFNDPDDLATLRQLVATADVLVENFRPSVMPGFGFVAEELVTEHPRLIYAALRGFPSDSELADCLRMTTSSRRSPDSAPIRPTCAPACPPSCNRGPSTR